MATLYWKNRVKVVIGEMSYAAALTFNHEAMTEAKARIDFESANANEQTDRLISGLLVKHATRAVETRDTPEGKWQPLKADEQRRIEVSEGEFVTLSSPASLQATLDMLDNLPVTLVNGWVQAATQANHEASSVPFLSWMKTPVTSTASSPAASPSPAPKRKRRSMTTAGADATIPTSLPDTSPSSEE